MRKLYLFFAAVAILAVAGCQKNTPGDENVPGYNEKEDPNRPSGNDDVSVSPEQYIQETAKALMDELNYSNWSSEAEFIHKVIVALQNKDFSDETLKNWSKALTDAWTMEPRREGNATIYETYIRISDAKGHFEEQPDGSFTKTDADDFQMTVLVDGEKVTSTLVYSDSKVPVRVSRRHFENYNYDTDEYSFEYFDTYVYVPSIAELKILRGSAEFARLNLNMSADIKDPTEVNPYTDSATIDAVLKIGVYTLSLQNVAYSPQGASARLKLLSGQSSLITVDANGIYELDPASREAIPIKSGAVDASVDIMGRIQVKGNVPDFVKFYGTMNSMKDKSNDGLAYKALVGELEKTFSAAMYFNGSSTPRATLGLDAVQYNTGSGYWTCNPVLNFSDGTSYTVQEYFSEEKFGDTISYAKSWYNGIVSYVSNLFSDIR